jgi:hypothetical protein
MPEPDREEWACRQCGSGRWVGWRSGPAHLGYRRYAQCVPCGNVQELPPLVTEEQRQAVAHAAHQHEPNCVRHGCPVHALVTVPVKADEQPPPTVELTITPCPPYASSEAPNGLCPREHPFAVGTCLHPLDADGNCPRSEHADLPHNAGWPMPDLPPEIADLLHNGFTVTRGGIRYRNASDLPATPPAHNPHGYC